MHLVGGLRFATRDDLIRNKSPVDRPSHLLLLLHQRSEELEDGFRPDPTPTLGVIVSVVTEVPDVVYYPALRVGHALILSRSGRTSAKPANS